MELLSDLKSSDEYKAIPVLILTAEGNPEEIKKARSLGAHGWLIKPFKEEILVNAVKSLVA